MVLKVSQCIIILRTDQKLGNDLRMVLGCKDIKQQFTL